MSYDLLHGTRIIESAAFIAAPLAGLTLAQYGAEVIRIDAIGGGIDYRRLPLAPNGRSLYWTSLNKMKRSIAVDIRNPEGRELVAALVTAPGPGGGVLLTNIATPWLDPATLSKQRADLVSCIIEGNADGTTAVDYTINCATGLPMLTGPGSQDRPVNHTLPAWDVACALQASTALLAALLRRQAGGAGAAIRIALSDVAFSTLSHLGFLTEAQIAPEARRSIGNDIYGAFGRDFASADGRRVMVAAISSRQWTSLVKACDMADAIAAIETATGLDFADEAQRYEGRDIIGALVKRWCEARPYSEVAETFDRHGVCWGKYQSMGEAVRSDPRISGVETIFERIDTEGVGGHLAAGSTARIAGQARQPTRAAPMLGADTDAVLSEVLGLNAAGIGRLHDRGIVAGPLKADPFAATLR